MTETTGRPLVTFAVIAYNQERYIREAIEGAFAQTYEPLEIILSDDCSPDRTYEIMQEMAAAYDGPHRVVLNRNEPNLGMVPHIDRVMEIATGGYVLINAGDDVSLPKRAEKHAKVWIESSRSIKLIHSIAYRVTKDRVKFGMRRPNPRIIESPTPLTLVKYRTCALGATVGLDKEIFDKFGPLGGAKTEDRIMAFRATLLGEIHFIEEPLVEYRMGGVSEGNENMTGLSLLYGIGHTGRYWAISNDEHILEAYSDFEYPDKSEVEDICRRRLPVLKFATELAQTSHISRFLMAPRALKISMASKNLAALVYWVSYTFDFLYIPYVNAKNNIKIQLKRFIRAYT
ncbi:glycosyltransferase [Roseovarius spongiae]|uniref:Glycosyltransferase n=1 Tax=Roseovarius spongiae TaxID=2320272 RepID=A0A3A8B1I2_9RHOB|nr:glycosyltransferase [Roseovarius spongiae]RKF12370.1 glycosyltransferase [Roseovarius spongiae]